MQFCYFFTDFDLQGPCETDYVIVTTYEEAAENEHKFCKNVSHLIYNDKLLKLSFILG